MRRFAFISFVLSLCASSQAASVAGASDSVSWAPDLIHSRAEFTVAHMVVSKVWGHIPIRQMTIVTPPGDPIPTQVAATLDPAHLDTDNRERDAVLRADTYFDVGHYPTIAFVSRKIVPKGPMDFIVTGDLSVRNVTRSVTVPMHVVGIVPDAEGSRVGYTGQLAIDRRDFGITDNTFMSGVLFVGYNVNIVLTVEATTAAPMPHRT